MKKITVITLLFSIVLACTPEQIIFPTSECSWRYDYTDHPKNVVYQNAINQYVELGLPGINLLVAKGKNDIWIGSAGVSRIETSEALKPCHTMPVGSVSKFFCGTAAMLMYEDGILDFDNTIAYYLGDEWSDPIPNAKSAAVGHLLSHTSGIPDYTDIAAFRLDLLNNKDMDLSRETVLENYVFNRRPAFSPGEQYSYSNSNYEVMTMIMDEIYPDGHADYYSFRLLTQLGLEKTYYKNETDYFTLSSFGMANGYIDRNADARLENATDLSLQIASGQTGSAGIVSNVSDLYTLMESVFEAKLISEASLEKMKTYILKKEGITEYLFGLGIIFQDFGEYGTAIGHGGSLPGFTTEAWYFPEQETYLIYQVNVGNMWSGPLEELVDNDFKQAILSAVFN